MMTEAEIIARALLLHPSFARLGEEGCKRCARSMRRQSLGVGQTLFLRGDRGDALYLVISGRLRLAVNTQEGRELSVRIVSAGEILGEIAALDEGPRSADATAALPTEVAMLPSDALRRLIVDYPDFGFALMRFLCGRLRDTTEQLETIALYPIEARLARFLLVSLKDRETARLKLGLSQGELAQLLGASRPKVSLAFGKLESLGAIKREQGAIVCDRAVLSQMLAGAGGAE